MEETFKLEETVKVVGDYNELESVNPTDETEQERKEADYDAQEAKDSLDIDDYEIDDDIDGSAEALDGFEEQ